jgi:hypothetical protein
MPSLPSIEPTNEWAIEVQDLALQLSFHVAGGFFRTPQISSAPEIKAGLCHAMQAISGTVEILARLTDSQPAPSAEPSPDNNAAILKAIYDLGSRMSAQELSLSKLQKQLSARPTQTTNSLPINQRQDRPCFVPLWEPVLLYRSVYSSERCNITLAFRLLREGLRLQMSIKLIDSIP